MPDSMQHIATYHRGGWLCRFADGNGLRVRARPEKPGLLTTRRTARAISRRLNARRMPTPARRKSPLMSAKGIHTAPSKSITVAEAANDWIGYIEGEGRERTTIHRYREIVRLHIVPRLGNEKLAKLTTPRINVFRDELVKS